MLINDCARGEKEWMSTNGGAERHCLDPPVSRLQTGSQSKFERLRVTCDLPMAVFLMLLFRMSVSPVHSLTLYTGFEQPSV